MQDKKLLEPSTTAWEGKLVHEWKSAPKLCPREAETAASHVHAVPAKAMTTPYSLVPLGPASSLLSSSSFSSPGSVSISPLCFDTHNFNASNDSSSGRFVNFLWKFLTVASLIAFPFLCPITSSRISSATFGYNLAMDRFS